MNNREFKGIWIPKEIWLSEKLTIQEKLFYVEIDSLDNQKGCFASNGYFSDFFGISKTRVSLVIKSLIEKGFVKSTIIYKEGTQQILKRVLNICYRPYLTKVKDPIQQKLKGNNTINNTINNKEEKGNDFLDQLEINKNWIEGSRNILSNEGLRVQKSQDDNLLRIKLLINENYENENGLGVFKRLIKNLDDFWRKQFSPNSMIQNFDQYMNMAEAPKKKQNKSPYMEAE